MREYDIRGQPPRQPWRKSESKIYRRKEIPEAKGRWDNTKPGKAGKKPAKLKPGIYK